MYADMGHFGRVPIRLAWFAVALPGLVLNYFGQAALLITDASALDNPFYQLAPDWAHYPLVAFATVATVIASQAIISGVFSLTQESNQLGFLPRMQIWHTTRSAILKFESISGGLVELVGPGVNDWIALKSSTAAMRRLSSCLEATRMWRRTERASLEKKPSTRLSQEPGWG